jgi:hypothetical protein
MADKNNFEAICSVSEMARRLCLSRARFYQLQKMGVFPKPIRCHDIKRPFYPLDLQQKCMEVRKTGIGLNGRPIIFNASRKNNKTKIYNNHLDIKFDEFCGELVCVLNEFKLKISKDKIKKAIQEKYPNGLEQYTVTRELINDLVEYFRKLL